MILVARPTHGSIKERHTRHERRYSPAVRSSIGCTQEIECWVRRRAALVGCGRASAARRREEARACRAPFVVHPGPPQSRAHPRECRRFSHAWKSHRRDPTGWPGRQDSNLGMAESPQVVCPGRLAHEAPCWIEGKAPAWLSEQSNAHPVSFGRLATAS